VLAVTVTASAHLPSTLARHAAGRFGHRGEAIFSDRSTAHLTGSVRALIAKLCGVPGLLLADGAHLPDRLVRFLGAHALRRVRVSEAPAHAAIVRLLHYVRNGHIVIAAMSSTPPLTPAVFHILLALSDGEKHGYEIMKRVRTDSHDRVRMGTGTLYGSIKRMLVAGLIEESGDRPDPDLDDQRRRYYRASELGMGELRSELKRYHDVVAVARRRRVGRQSLAFESL
jgi:DNA-binding PadR family transcriptional regulator